MQRQPKSKNTTPQVNALLFDVVFDDHPPKPTREVAPIPVRAIARFFSRENLTKLASLAETMPLAMGAVAGSGGSETAAGGAGGAGGGGAAAVGNGSAAAVGNGGAAAVGIKEGEEGVSRAAVVL